MEFRVPPDINSYRDRDELNRESGQGTNFFRLSFIEWLYLDSLRLRNEARDTLPRIGGIEAKS